MRLHRLRLSNVRGVTERTVEFPDTGVVVVEGPNEVGKTTMIEALDLLLDDKDSSRKRHVLSFRPVGRDVASVVEADLSSGPYRFTYRKQWFRQPGTELHISAPRVEQLTGVEAHERVSQILAETADLVLWRALRLMQAVPLVQADLSGSSALAAALDVAAMPAPGTADGIENLDGAQMAGGASGGADPDADSIVVAAEAEYRRYFTAGQGQPTGTYRAARERLDLAVDAARAARAAVEEVQYDVERHAVVAAEGAQAERDVDAAAAEAAELDRQWHEVETLAAAEKAARGQLEAAARSAQRARDRWEERASRGQALTDNEAVLARQTVQAGELARQLGPAEAACDALTERLREAEAVAAGVRRRAQAAAAVAAYRRDVAELADLQDRLTRLTDLARARDAALADLAACPLDQPSLAAIERAAAAVDIALAAQAAGSATVVVTALKDQPRLSRDGVPDPMAAGERRQHPVAEPLALEVPGLRVEVLPEEGAQRRAGVVRAARTDLSRLLEAAGADDLAHARRLGERHQLAAALLRRADQGRIDLLGGAREEDLIARAQRLQGSIADEPPADEPPADEPGEIAAVPEPEEDPEAVVARLTGELRGRREAVDRLRLEVATTASLVEAVRGQLDAERARLAASRAVEPDAALQAAAEQADGDLAQAESAARELSAALAERDPATLRSCRGAAQSALAAARDRHRVLRDERIAIEARLAAAGGQGRQERFDDAESELVHAQRAFDAVDRRAKAARLLFDTLQRRRAEAKRGYLTPYANELTRFGRLVYGDDFDVEVSDDLSIAARVLHGRTIPFGALSTGAKEQLAVLTRLACASLVDPADGVPVIIDDALGYTDPERLRTICAAFALRGAGAQLILLTCTPGRYAGIPDATIVRL
ncbi:MAG: AAA family ATPase [Austwickia sp.]|nr:AAA family ATPase [Austwickia sp.]MBK9101944.1 AAA family ATPase [Austwickia sp.]